MQIQNALFYLFAVGFVSFEALAADEDITSITISAEYATEYVFRGVTRQGEAIQPAIEAKYGDLRIGAWGSLAIGSESEAFVDEIDLYAGFSWDLGDRVKGEIGGILYHYPQLGSIDEIDVDEAGTVEVFGTLDFDVFLSPKLSAFYDVHLETVTVQADISRSLFMIKPVTFEVFGNIGGVESSGSESLDYLYGRTGLTAYIDVTEKAYLFGSAFFGVSSEDTFLDTNFDLSDPDTLADPKDNSAWFKFGVSSTF